MDQVRKIHFNSLSQDARRRFVDSVEKQQGVQPLQAMRTSPSTAIVGWLFLALTGAAGAFIVWNADFGGYRFLQGVGWVALYLLAFFMVFAGVFGIVKRSIEKNALPYTPGRYLFPGSYVDARRPRFRIMPMGQLANIRGVHHHTNGVYSQTMIHLTFTGGGRDVVSVRGKQKAELLMGQLEKYRMLLLDPVTASDPSVGLTLDPLFGEQGSDFDHHLIGQPSSLGHGELLAGSIPAFLSRPWTVGFVVACLVCVPAWMARNSASDDVAFERVQMEDTIYSYEDYIWKGGKHSEEVQRDFIPRAQFREAAGSAIQLRQFLVDNPDHDYAEEAREGVGELYEQALANFAARSSAGPENLAFVEALLNWLEASDTGEMNVVFAAPTTSMLETMDMILQMDGANIAPAASHFTDSASSSRQTRIVTQLQEGLSAVFVGGVLNLIQQGSPQAFGNELNEVERPTMHIRYDVGPSGMVYELEGSTREYAGILVAFYVEMTVPDYPSPLSFSVEVEPPENFMVYDSGLGYYGADPLATGYPADPYGSLNTYSDSSVYAQMADHAFDRLAGRVNEAFFGASQLQTDY